MQHDSSVYSQEQAGKKSGSSRQTHASGTETQVRFAGAEEQIRSDQVRSGSGKSPKSNNP